MSDPFKEFVEQISAGQGPPPRTRRKRGTQSQVIGRSKGGMTTKILALADALGNLVLLPGQRFDTIGVALTRLSRATRSFAELNERGAKIVIIGLA